MIRCLALVSLLALPTLSSAQAPAEALARAPELLRPGLQAQAQTRAIRRDVPLTGAIRRAMEAGTRDFSGRPGPSYWQLQADYTITATLDRPTCSIVGAETIAVHNHSTQPLTTLVLRLDHNLFRDRAQRGSSVPAEITEGMVITRMAIDGAEVDLTARARGRRRPAADAAGASVSGLDQTVATVRLDKPIAPGATASLLIEWRTKLPGGDGGAGHRMTQRWDDTLFQPTQWYPRLAKYDDLNGWNEDPYLGPAEFYNNFGRFDVRIDVPAGWLVSGTGVLQNPEEVLTAAARQRLAKVLESDVDTVIVGEDEVGPGKATAEPPAGSDRLVWHFVADQVNDFAWATAQNFVWKATRATIPGKGPIPIHMVHLPERARNFRNAGSIARHALEFYSSLWVPYPFPQLTMQDGPSAGMEYPMVINSNQGAADHETAHQWWPMMVGNNETRFGWMDEGFNTYMNILSDAHRRGRAPSLDGRGQSYGQISGDENEPPMMWNANYSGDMYGFTTYMKAPMMLSMLGGIVGDDAVQKAMKEYSGVWAFKHPSPWDFAFFMDNALGRDLGWFWYYWLWTTESVDGSIQDVREVDGQTIVTVRQDGQMPSPVVLLFEFVGDAKPPAGANLVAVDDGSMQGTWPVDVWFAGSRTFEVKLPIKMADLAKVTLDPAGRFPDRDKRDNVWSR